MVQSNQRNRTVSKRSISWVQAMVAYESKCTNSLRNNSKSKANTAPCLPASTQLTANYP